MSKKWGWVLFVSLIIGSCKPSEKSEAEKKAIEDSIVVTNKKNQIKPLLDSILSKNNFNGNVSVNWDNKNIYQRSNGFSNFKKKVKNNQATVFPIASNSKQFTGVLILKLEEKGLLKLNDKVSIYLKSYQIPAYKNIRISQLLHHSSGINYLGEQLLFQPGSHFHYSNDAYQSLGDIIEKITEKSYDDNVLALFKDLNMLQSSTGNRYSGSNFSSAYLGKATAPTEVPNMPKRLDKNHISIAAGGILSTSNDLHRWNDALYNGSVLSSEAFDQFIKPNQQFEHSILGKVDYACGIMLSPKSPKTYMHTGYVKGAPSLSLYYPDTKTSVIILSNIADESLGKKAIYKTHRQIKFKIDSIQKLWAPINSPI